MPDNEVVTAEALPDAGDIAAPEANAAAPVTGLKDILSKELGKSFPTDEAAIKSLKDTFSFVGKAGSYQKAMKSLTVKLGLSMLGVSAPERM